MRDPNEELQQDTQEDIQYQEITMKFKYGKPLTVSLGCTITYPHTHLVNGETFGCEAGTGLQSLPDAKFEPTSPVNNKL